MHVVTRFRRSVFQNGKTGYCKQTHNTTDTSAMKIFNRLFFLPLATATALLLLPCANARLMEEFRCDFTLATAGDEAGSAHVYIKHNKLKVDFRNAKPDTLYTIWVDFRSRATGIVAGDYPFEDSRATLFTGVGIGRGVAPAFAKTAPVYEGMRLDENSIVTDFDGNADFEVDLDYDLLGYGTCPVVAAALSLQGDNRVGGSWLRRYGEQLMNGASPQRLMADGTPQLALATAEGLTIVGHTRKVTHGHTPGVGGVDHFPAFIGDFPQECGR